MSESAHIFVRDNDPRSMNSSVNSGVMELLYSCFRIYLNEEPRRVAPGFLQRLLDYSS